MSGPANRRVTPGVPLFSMSPQANVTTLTARTARSLHQGGHSGLLSALLLSLMALLAATPVCRAATDSNISITYNSRKDRLTVIVGRVRKVIPNVHSALAALGLADDPTVYIRDIAAQVTAGRVSAINGVQFNATAPQ